MQARVSTVIARLHASRVVPVVELPNRYDARTFTHGLLTSGLSSVEIAFRSDAAVEGIRGATQVEGLLVGAGTVLTVDQLDAAVEAGAHFAVAPGTNEEVLEAAMARDLPFFPGVATPTEIERAIALGIGTVKVFPVSHLGGVGFLRSVAATYPEMKFIPTGGVGWRDMHEYLGLSCVLACGKSWSPAVDRFGAPFPLEAFARNIDCSISKAAGADRGLVGGLKDKHDGA